MHTLMQYCSEDLSPGLYQEFLERLDDDDPIVWARYGDGEFRAIFHMKGRNASGHQFFPDLGDRLRAILNKNPEYEVGLQRNAVRKFGDRILKEFPFVDWTSTEFLHDMSQREGLNDFFYTLINKNVILVGPDYLRDLLRIFPFEHIEVPLIDCWLDHDRILDETKAAIKAYYDQEEPVVVLFAAAMLTNVLIDELYMPDEPLSLIDVGAAFDPYAGKLTRGYHRRMVIRMPEWTA